ncbi:unnamed protein product [Agarophyton chilense]
MEEIFGDSVRLPFFEIDNHALHTIWEDGFDRMVEEARDRPFALRPVRQNALKASLLFEKPQLISWNGPRTRYRCRLSISEILRNASVALSKHVPIGNIRNFRRSLEERKKDWRTVMSQIAVEEVNHTSEAKSISSPVLPSLLPGFNMNQKLDISGVLMLPVPFPHEPIAIANMWTNMVFDLEMLGIVLEENWNRHRSAFKDSGNDTNIIESEYCQSHSRSSIINTFLVFKSSEAWCIRPVTGQSPFKTILRCPARNALIDLEACFPGYNDRIHLQRTSALEDLSRFERSHEEETVLRLLHSIRKPISFTGDLETLKQLKTVGFFSRDVEAIRHAVFEQDDTLKSNGPSLRTSSTTILSGSFLQAKTPSVQTVQGMGLQARLVPKTGKDSCLRELLHSLHQQVKIRRVTALWSSGSREVMRKCRLGESILLRVFESRPILVEMTKGSNLFPVTQRTSGNGIFGFERGPDTILRTLAMKSKSFLPLFVDLTEALRFVFHLEEKQRIQPLKSFEKRLDQHHGYDVFSRNQSTTLTERINIAGAIHVSVPSDNISSKDEFEHLKEERDGENTSHESALNDILTSDEDQEEPEPNPAIAFVQPEPKQHEKIVGTRKKEYIANEDVFEGKSNERNPQKIRLRVPENLMCSPWALRLAERCIAKMPRGAILLPPCLSVLPSLCVIISTYLSDRLQDQRVAVVCEADSDISSGLSSYLEYSFAYKTSVEIVKRWNLPDEPRYAPLHGFTAQILILDSFEFSLPAGVSLLLVLVCEPRIICSQLQLSVRQQRYSVNPEWPRLASILIAPIDCWIPFPSYIDRAKRLSLELKTNTVMFMADYDDVHVSVLLAKPRTLFLAPLKEAAELISAIDCHSSEALGKLRRLFRKVRPGWRNEGTNRLSDFSVSFLRSILENQLVERNSETYCDLESVYYLRQARSYALCDGFEVAMAFLSHCGEELHQNNSGWLQKVMKQAEAIDPRIISSDDHPIVSPVAAHMRKTKETCKKEPPSLSSTHRREAFLPLIVADSREVVDGFRRGCTKAKLLLEAGDQDIAVCWSYDLVSISNGKTKSIQQTEVIERLKGFTHIYHIVDDRENNHSELQFPPGIMQLVHAGRTRLITVVVDERREFESIWRNSNNTYDTLRKHIGDLSRLSGFKGVDTLKEINWEAMTRMLNSLW